ncbi:ABC transporter [Plantactinospora sp. BB1]|uniref:ABC transporter n=1 Tax=Plantactinospora sp. BB1 TaxID=2071627 RepID=UPI000D209C99|nr:ABC transporter [Plantactinospora sp. BB1]
MTTHGEPATGLGTPLVGPETPIADAGREPAESTPRHPPADPAAATEQLPTAPVPPGTAPAADSPAGDGSDLRWALTRLRAAIDVTAYPLTLPGADEARQLGSTLRAQLADYLLPRLARLDAPLLVVVGGSTGAGKSTLVNSLVQARVSSVGVLRPTTRSPVLVCSPLDSAWFRQGDLLPGLTRTTTPGDQPDTLHLVTAPALPAGLAFLDAPDIDSVVDANRVLAAQLLAAADLWLFVTTAARYADAVPWELLHTARLRGTAIALVLDRVPPAATDEVAAHLAEMLAEHQLGAAPLFVLPETVVDGQGLLPGRLTEPLRSWFGRLAADSEARAAVIRQTLHGAVAALVPAVESLATAADQQANAAQALDERVRSGYRGARRSVEEALRDGRLLRGEVLARWQEFVGTGELFRTLEARVGQLRDRVVAALTGRPAPNAQLRSAIESQLVTLLREAAATAAEQTAAAWQTHPAGAALLTPELSRPAEDLPERAERLVRDWQRDVLELVRAQGGDKRFVARSAAYAVNATGLAVMIAVFASTAFIPTGLEVAAAGGTTVAAQKVLEAIFGDQAIRTLATRARADLLGMVDRLFDEEAARYLARTAAAGVDAAHGDQLREAARLVDAARGDAGETAGAEATR